MTIVLHIKGGRVLVWEYGAHEAIDAMVSAIKDNVPNWERIEITIKAVE